MYYLTIYKQTKQCDALSEIEIEYNGIEKIMARKVQHSLLTKAKANKKDEFYTQLVDIESELQHYENHFKDKIVYCNCDDPSVSNFFKYFFYNFEKLGLKKLITSSYKNQGSGFFSEYTRDKIGRSGTKIEIVQLKGDGDFRSKESIELLKKSDIVVTNPPFSLFREYVEQIINYDKKFLIIGKCQCNHLQRKYLS